jgi:glucose/arabinose dehydrogenase
MRLRHAMCAIVVLALVGAACGGDDDDNSNDASNGSPPTSNEATTTPSTGTTATTDANTVPDLGNVSVKFTQVLAGLEQPVDFAVRKGDDDAYYIAEQHVGRVVRVVGNKITGAPVLDIGNEVTQGNEQGLLGIAFSPDGSLLYINYTDTAGDSHVQEFVMKGNVADMSTRRNVLTVDQPFANHNGGNIEFGPDGMLYIGFGDGGAAGDPSGNAQNLGTLLGKMLRINPKTNGSASYSVPSGNPFVGRANARPEIWMYGLRNPWRYQFDKANGDLWIGDVGQNAWEEIDYAAAGTKGTNWGWDQLEGDHPYDNGTAPPNAVAPIVEESHQDGWCAIVGGFVYRGSRVPAMRGAYLYSDNCLGDVVALTQRGGKLVDHRSLGNAGNVASFGEDANGELYIVALGGSVYRVDPA